MIEQNSPSDGEKKVNAYFGCKFIIEMILRLIGMGPNDAEWMHHVNQARSDTKNLGFLPEEDSVRHVMEHDVVPRLRHAQAKTINRSPAVENALVRALQIVEEKIDNLLG